MGHITTSNGHPGWIKTNNSGLRPASKNKNRLMSRATSASVRNAINGPNSGNSSYNLNEITGTHIGIKKYIDVADNAVNAYT